MATTVATTYINVTCPAIPSLARAFPEPLLLCPSAPVLNTGGISANAYGRGLPPSTGCGEGVVPANDVIE
jgi:hypothetical protein